MLDGISLQVAEGEIACLLGPSGCGKTTLLRMIAGLETADTGAIGFDGVDLTDVPVHRRSFGLMFQDYALFPHMSVAQNVGYGLRMAGAGAAAVRARVDEMLELVDLPGYAARSIDALSGGEQQRVALARTLAPAPRLVLLDEPLANLDRRLRETLVDDLRTILKRIGVTTLFVTHDQQEAFALADRVVVMRAGRIEQNDRPEQLFAQPANAFVAGFLGFHNLLPVERVDGNSRMAATSIGALPIAYAQSEPAKNSKCSLLIRPDAAVLADESVAAGWPTVKGQVVNASFRGSISRVQITADADPSLRLTFDLPTRSGRPLPPRGTPIDLALNPEGVILIGEE